MTALSPSLIALFAASVARAESVKMPTERRPTRPSLRRRGRAKTTHASGGFCLGVVLRSTLLGALIAWLLPYRASGLSSRGVDLLGKAGTIAGSVPDVTTGYCQPPMTTRGGARPSSHGRQWVRRSSASFLVPSRKPPHRSGLIQEGR